MSLGNIISKEHSVAGLPRSVRHRVSESGPRYIYVDM